MEKISASTLTSVNGDAAVTNEERHQISRRLMIRAIPYGWYRTKRGTIVASIGPPVPREDPGDLASPRFHSADAEFFGPDALDDATAWLLGQAFNLYPESMAARDDDLAPWDAEIDRLACHAAETFGDDAVHEATARVRRATIPLEIPRTAINVATCRRMTKEELGPRAASALDEAAHAVVMYRAVGVTSGVSIAPHEQILGHVSDHLSDSTAPVDLEARILCCYAGGRSQRRFAVRPNSEDCQIDDEIAADLLRTLGAESREGDFRSRAKTMVDQYWPQVVAVATQLWERGVLDGSEVQIICDQVSGDADADALDAYRRERSWGPKPGRDAEGIS